LRTPIALDAIRLISQEVKDADRRRGHDYYARTVKAAEEAGAVFAISPGLTPALLAAAKAGNIALIPGISTLSELMTGMEYAWIISNFFRQKPQAAYRC